MIDPNDIEEFKEILEDEFDPNELFCIIIEKSCNDDYNELNRVAMINILYDRGWKLSS